MITFDIEAIRAEVRAMDFTRGTPAEVAMWREDMAESRANLVGGTSRFVIWTAAVGTNGQQRPERCRKVY